jgi:hypothetical protein
MGLRLLLHMGGWGAALESWENSYLNVVGLGSAVRQALDIGLDRIGRRGAALAGGCGSVCPRSTA